MRWAFHRLTALSPSRKGKITTGKQEVTLRSVPYSKIASSRLSHHVSVVTQSEGKTVLGTPTPSLPVLPCCVLCSLTLMAIAMGSQESPSSLLERMETLGIFIHHSHQCSEGPGTIHWDRPGHQRNQPRNKIFRLGTQHFS